MFVRGGRLALLPLVVVVSLAGLTGCGGGGSKPVSLPTLPSTSSPLTPSTSSQTELDAVSAVVRRYFALTNGPTTEAAASELFAIMTPQCKCRRVASSIRDLAAKQQHYFGGVRITSFVPNIDGVAAADVLVEYDYRNGGIKDNRDRVLTRSRGHKGVRVDFRLLKQHGVWVIDIVEALNDGTPL